MACSRRFFSSSAAWAAAASLAACLPVGPAAAADPPRPSIGPVNEPSLHLVALNVADLDRSIAFYGGGMGMKEITRFTSPQGAEVLMGYRTDQAWIVLVHKTGQPELQMGNGFSRIGFLVPSVAEVLDRARKAGYPVLGEPRQAQGALLGFLSDPDGYRVELVQPNGRNPGE